MEQEQESRYVEYLGESDWAKVEEHPFQDKTISCMLLLEGHLKGRSLTPDQARKLADHLNRVAEKIEQADEGRRDLEE